MPRGRGHRAAPQSEEKGMAGGKTRRSAQEGEVRAEYGPEKGTGDGTVGLATPRLRTSRNVPTRTSNGQKERGEEAQVREKI